MPEEFTLCSNEKGELMRKTIIYIACPMTNGYWTDNVIACLDAANKLIERGYCPIVPVMTWMWDLYSKKSQREWLEYDFGLIAIADAILRIPGPSPGSDEEVGYAVGRGVPVFFALPDLYNELPANMAEEIDYEEDQIDVQTAKAAIKKGKFIDPEDLARELGV